MTPRADQISTASAAGQRWNYRHKRHTNTKDHNMKRKAISTAILATAGVATFPASASPGQVTEPAVPIEPTAPVEAVEGMAPDSGLAWYDGEVRDLSEEGWGTANICSVYEDGMSFCFATTAEADAHAAVYQPEEEVGLASRGTPCTDEDRWLELFENANGQGRDLRFRDRSVTQNLSDWDFENKASSWRSDLACNASGYTDFNGGGNKYEYMYGVASGPHCIPYGTWAPNCGDNLNSTWNDSFKSIRIHAG